MHQYGPTTRSAIALTVLLCATGFAGCIGNDGNSPDQWQARFTPAIDLAACNSGNATLALGAIVPDFNGDYVDVWPSSAAARVQVTVQLGLTSFFGTLKCASSGANGQMSGTLDMGGYTGHYSFGGQTGNVTLVPIGQNGRDDRNNNGGCQGPNCGYDDCGNQGCNDNGGCQGPNCGGYDDNDCRNQGCYNDGGCQGSNCGDYNHCNNQGCNNQGCQGSGCNNNQGCTDPNCGNNNQGCCGGPTPTSNSPFNPAGIWTVTFSPQIDVSSCENSVNSFSSQVIDIPSSGQFTTVWQGTLRVTGGLSGGAFDAHTSCFSNPPSGGNPTGGLWASRENNDLFRGGYNHYGIQGTLMLTRGGSTPPTTTPAASPTPTASPSSGPSPSSSAPTDPTSPSAASPSASPSTSAEAFKVDIDLTRGTVRFPNKYTGWGVGGGSATNYVAYPSGWGVGGSSTTNYVALPPGWSAGGGSTSNHVALGPGWGSGGDAATNFVAVPPGGSTGGSSGTNFVGLGPGWTTGGAAGTNFVAVPPGWSVGGNSATNFVAVPPGWSVGGNAATNFVAVPPGWSASQPGGSRFVAVPPGWSAAGAAGTNGVAVAPGWSVGGGAATNFVTYPPVSATTIELAFNDPTILALAKQFQDSGSYTEEVLADIIMGLQLNAQVAEAGTD